MLHIQKRKNVNIRNDVNIRRDGLQQFCVLISHLLDTTKEKICTRFFRNRIFLQVLQQRF